VARTGIAYDTTRDLLWVPSTGTNEVVGYDMTDAKPREVRRLPTVQNPNTLGVDPTTGRLFIAGMPGGVVLLQWIADPDAPPNAAATLDALSAIGALAATR
jgi:DNA-binding beta-propeller fold protein YncE